MAKFTCNFISYTLQRTVDITVIVPSVTIPESLGMGAAEGEKPALTHRKGEKYPVLYLLHGFGNNHTAWNAYTNVELYAEERQIAVVCLSAENKAYVDQPRDKFYDFVARELPDFVLGMFPVSDRPEDTYIAGLSMGGYGTLVHALREPERFTAFGAFSAAVSSFGGNNEEADPDKEPALLLEKAVKEGRKLPKAYMACGTEDFLMQADREFRDKLIAAGADVTWDQLEGYGHEWRFWDIQVEKFLQWIEPLRTDAYAGAVRKV